MASSTAAARAAVAAGPLSRTETRSAACSRASATLKPGNSTLRLSLRQPESFSSSRSGQPLVVRAQAPGRHFAAVVKTQPISFQFDETSFSVAFSPELAQQLKESIDKLLQTFREKEKATRPQRWEGLDFRHSSDGVFIEVFCNPNAYSNAFQAKALVTIKSESMRLSSEGPLSNVKSSVEEYLAAN